jgi:hypothetical protein
VKEEREGKRRVVKILSKDLTVRVVPFTAEEEVFRCLFCTAAAVWAIYFIHSMKVGFVVAMADFELIKSAYNISFCSYRNNKLLSKFPREFCRVCVWIPLDSCWSGFDKCG